ncbi:MAG: ATP synthase F0 subunit C [Thermodesulfobacteriota bacterium]|nr:ATP synthase F0 subunit C [Thermodesulfobacteriota bacterium]
MKKMMWILLLTLALSCSFASFAFAAEPLGQEAKKFIGLTCGLVIAIAALGGAIGQGIAISKGLEGIARNPEAQPKIFIPMILGLALIESLVIYALVISIMLYGKL